MWKGNYASQKVQHLSFLLCQSVKSVRAQGSFSVKLYCSRNGPVAHDYYRERDDLNRRGRR